MGIYKKHDMRASRFGKVLVPVSLEIESTIAFRQALYFRKVLGSEITLFHAITGTNEMVNVLQPNVNKSLQGRGMVRLIRFAKNHFRGRIPEDVKLRVEVGNHVSLINTIANTERFDLIVLNRSNRIEGLTGKFTRHNIDQIVEESVCPVVSVNDRWTGKGIRDILVPVDVSKSSRELLNWSIVLGKMFGANIKLLAALSVDIELTRSLPYRKTEIMKSIIEREDLNCIVDIVVKEKTSRGDSLLEGARKIKADILLVQGFQDLMFGDSQNEKLLIEFIHNSNRPVFSLGIKRNGFISDIMHTKINKTDLSERISGRALQW